MVGIVAVLTGKPSMPLETLIENYGYAIVLVGTFLEGETVLVLGGMAAKLGYLKLPWVIASAFVGTLLGDQFYFFLGRRHGQWFLNRHPNWRSRMEKAHRLLARHYTLVILGFRFMYGLRTVTPFVLGMGRIGALRFFAFNLISALLWATSFGILSYLFGHALELLLGKLKHYELEVMSLIAICGAVVWAAYGYRRKLQGIDGRP